MRNNERCNDLEKYLLQRSCSEQTVDKETFRARTIPRDALLGKVNSQEKYEKATFNITYHQVFQHFRMILEELRACDA